ncbi:MAG: hypothetical protein U0835_26230 [Isosphaeraceae bacterium]
MPRPTPDGGSNPPPPPPQRENQPPAAPRAAATTTRIVSLPAGGDMNVGVAVDASSGTVTARGAMKR